MRDGAPTAVIARRRRVRIASFARGWKPDDDGRVFGCSPVVGWRGRSCTGLSDRDGVSCFPCPSLRYSKVPAREVGFRSEDNCRPHRDAAAPVLPPRDLRCRIRFRACRAAWPAGREGGPRRVTVIDSVGASCKGHRTVTWRCCSAVSSADGCRSSRSPLHFGSVKLTCRRHADRAAHGGVPPVTVRCRRRRAGRSQGETPPSS